MRKQFFGMLILLLWTSVTLAATNQKWTAGWDNFGEPLNDKKSKVSWTVTPANSRLTVTFTLVGATPNKLYQVGIDLFCATFPATFAQFPSNRVTDGNCDAITKGGVTKTAAEVELGVVRTDIFGNGSFAVKVGPVPSGSYNVEFHARDGAGCFLNGGAGNAACNVDFQSPGPWGVGTTVVVP